MKKSVSSIFCLPRWVVIFGTLILGILTFSLVPATALAAPQTCGVKDTSCVIQFGDQQITARLTALQKLNTTVTDDQTKQTIDNDHANSILQDIKTNVDGLNTLKAKLDAETDTKAARDDVASIYTKFRIYAVVLPRDHRRLQLATEITVDKKLTDLKASLEQAIGNADAKKKATLDALYADYKDQLTDAESNINNAQQTWSLLTVDSYNTDRQTFNINKRNLINYVQKVHNDLHKAAQDLHQMNQELKS